MWILYSLFIIGLQNKIVPCDCNDLLREARVEAVNLKTGYRKPQLEDDHFWTAFISNDEAYFVFNFWKVMKVTKIIIRRDDEKYEGISAYSLSYSLNGINYSDYKAEIGNVKIFRSNMYDGSELRCDFEVPVIAQYIRIHPIRWKNSVSARIAFYGFNYDLFYYYFNGSSLIQWNLQNLPIKSSNDLIKFRFKTSGANGVILYGSGVQNDHFALSLKDNRMLLTVSLGANHVTSLSAGSILDDEIWHDVVVSRTDRTISLSVDRIFVYGNIEGDFTVLNLDYMLYVGGVPRNQSDLKISNNYTGCIDSLLISWMNMNEAQIFEEIYSHIQNVNVQRGCQDSTFPSLTLLNHKSFIKLVGFDKVSFYDVSLEFRTYEEFGLLIYHEFLNEGYLKVFLEKGKLWTHLLTESSQLIKIQNYEDYFSDGRWNFVGLSIRTNKLTITVNGNPTVTIRLISISSGTHTFIGGGAHDVQGFIGCMKKISINQNYKDLGNWQPNEEYCCGNDIIFNSCRMIDRCNPNPCEHNGICHQTSTDFYCDCSDTGYGGAVCHQAILPINCEAYLRNKVAASEDIRIDIDGSGLLDGFPVTCQSNSYGKTITILHHENEDSTLVDGFQDAGSYVQTIKYRANIHQIEALINQSNECWQNIRYECFRSKLFNSPSSEEDFNPFSWWVSHYNQKMDFWGNSIEGSRKCECGMLQQCKNKTKWCNCDAGFYEWRSDGGDIIGKQYLPVKQLRFGDTGSLVDDKKGKYTLGPLICEGNENFKNVVTLRRGDVAIQLPTLRLENTNDFYFEFKTAHIRGIIAECFGKEDRFVISLEDGHSIRLIHEINGVRYDTFGKHSSLLSDNEWHAVYIEINRKEIRVIIDGNEQKDLRNEKEALLIMELTSSLSIGGSVDPSTSSGFVGCLRAFLINGKLVDLVSYARQFPYGLSVGCTGKCISNPCLNNGTCIDYYDSYACDCRWTSFKGPICADEIGVTLNGNNGVIYKFPSNRLSTISESIRVGFTTTRPQGFLLGLYSSISEEYMTISITNSGHLRVIFNFGFERQEVIYPLKHFDRGQFHDLSVSRRNSGSILRLQADDRQPIETYFNVKFSADAQFDNVQYLYIGKNESMNEGFVGCISRIEFNDIYPLKLLFQQNPPNNILSLGDVNEDFCGVEPVTHPPEPIEVRPSPNVNINIKDNTFMLVSTWSGLLLFSILIIFFLGKYTANRRAFYHTQEQIGAEVATDADNAVMHSKTGHVVFKKREWFI